MNNLLTVENLNVTFHTEDEVVEAVREVSFTVERGKTHGIVGESGSGKSATCHAILGLTPENGVVGADRIDFQGKDIAGLQERDLERIRGKDIAMIFQDPMTSLNPVHTIGRQIAESLRLHQNLSKGQAVKAARDLLDTVGIPEPAQRVREYPHQLSGGMCQRAMIAMALACRPALLIADEPTTALDVTVQAQILELMKRLQDDIGMSIILVTHDLGVIAEVADHMTVMRYGRVVEDGPVGRVFEQPEHPYTRELLADIPRLDRPSPIYIAPTPPEQRP